MLALPRSADSIPRPGPPKPGPQPKPPKEGRHAFSSVEVFGHPAADFLCRRDRAQKQAALSPELRLPGASGSTRTARPGARQPDKTTGPSVSLTRSLWRLAGLLQLRFRRIGPAARQCPAERSRAQRSAAIKMRCDAICDARPRSGRRGLLGGLPARCQH